MLRCLFDVEWRWRVARWKQSIKARFDTECAVCELDIDEGEDICEVDGSWVHAECAEREGYAVEA